MSILSSLYHGQIHDNPNATHNIPPGRKQDTARMDAQSAAMGPQPLPDPAGELPSPESVQRQLHCENAPGPRITPQQARKQAQELNCVPGSRQVWQARLTGSLRPELYYSQQQAIPDPRGWVESPHTVADKLEQREEFPRG